MLINDIRFVPLKFKRSHEIQKNWKQRFFFFPRTWPEQIRKLCSCFILFAIERSLECSKYDKPFFFQTFDSFFEAYFQWSEFNTQAFCSLFGHLIFCHIWFVIRTRVIYKGNVETKLYSIKLSIVQTSIYSIKSLFVPLISNCIGKWDRK